MMNGILDTVNSTERAAEASKQIMEKALSKADQRLLQAAETIASRSPTGDDLAFIHAIFCQVGLPRSKVSGQHFMRRSGDAWLSVQAGYLDEGTGPVQQALPYGAMPRLALAHVSTYALRFTTREIPIGRNAAQFLELMGLSDGGKQYGTMRAQMHALAACRLQLGYIGRTFNGQPVEQFDAWQKSSDTKQGTLWPGVMLLSQNFYDSLQDGCVPLDREALRALRGSALALDLYTWLASRLHRVEGPTRLMWSAIRDQFGQEYEGKAAAKDFKKAFLPALHKVKMVYPKACVEQVRGGLMLKSSPPPVAK
jgi:hypothetical protein